MTSDATRRWISEGDAYRDRGQLAKAAEAYRRAVELEPDLGWVHVQLGNMLKDTGRYSEAEQSYRTALANGSDIADTNVQLGRALRLAGRRDAALLAFTGALKAAPQSRDVLDELIALGESWSVQQHIGLGASVIADVVASLAAIRATLRRVERLLPEVASLAAIPPSHWDLWRRLWQAPLPPRGGLPIGLLVLADPTPLPALLACIASVEMQERGLAGAVIVSSDAEVRDAVARRAGLSRVDLGAASGPAGCGVAAAVDAALTLPQLVAVEWLALTNQPLVLDPQAAAWLSAMTAGPDLAGIFCDEDTVVLTDGRPSMEWERCDPLLKGAADPELVEQGYSLGNLLVVRRTWLSDALTCLAGQENEPSNPAAFWLALQRALLAAGPIGHVPHVIVSRERSIIEIRSAEQPVRRSPAPVLLSRSAAQPIDQRIDVIVPTRDRVDLLRPCLTSLKAMADRPRDYFVTVIDNGSTETETRRFLEQARMEGLLHRILRFDEVFNWARLSNKAVAQSEAALLLFANNDIEMISAGWDDRLRAHLFRAEVGAVGARLLYGDRTVQHAGIVLGTQGGGSEHEGRGAAADDAGPDRRWLTRRSVAAVTGAFLACRRANFDLVRGFDAERFGVWFNDVDFCLKLRARGLRVIYEPAIEAFHHESKSLAVEFRDRSRPAHFQAASAAMRERWGALFEHDPYFNPHYARWGTPFAWLRPPAGS